MNNSESKKRLLALQKSKLLISNATQARRGDQARVDIFKTEPAAQQGPQLSHHHDAMGCESLRTYSPPSGAGIWQRHSPGGLCVHATRCFA